MSDKKMSVSVSVSELIAERDRLTAEFEDLCSRNGGIDNMDAWPDGQITRGENTTRALNRVEDQILTANAERAEYAAKVEKVRIAALDPRNHERAVPTAADLRGGTVSRGSTPWAGLERAGSIAALDSDTGLRTRAADAVETFEGVPDAGREGLARMLEDDRTSDSARFVLALGNPSYRGAFEAWLRSPETSAMDSTPAELAAWRDVASLRTALNLSGGAALLPLALDPTIHLSNNGSAGIRDYANVKLTTSNTLRTVASPGITAEIKAEGVEGADATPTVGAVDLTVYQGFASVMASYEIFDDTNLAQQLGGMFMDARTRLEDELFVTGSGSGAPYGVITRLGATTASRVTPTTGGTFTTASVADIYKVRDAVAARHRQSPGVVWLSNISILSLIQQMSPSANGGSFWSNLNEGVPARLLGIPVLEATSMVSTATTGSLILACVDLREYVIGDRLGVEVMRHNVAGSSGGRSTGQFEFTARWRTSGDMVVPTAGRVLKL